MTRYPGAFTRVRAGLRSAALLAALLVALLESRWTPQSPVSRQRWMLRWCRRILKILRVRCRISGEAPDRGLLVSNHLSYLDILVLGAHAPGVFVAKSEVRSWPVLGLLAKAAGTVFAQRSRERSQRRLIQELSETLRGKSLTVLFPEGTTTNGSCVLPFHAVFFRAAIAAEAGVSVAAVRYAAAGDRGASSVCYWGDMVLLPHLFRLAKLPFVEARLSFGPRATIYKDARAAAELTRLEILRLLGLQL